MFNPCGNGLQIIKQPEQVAPSLYGIRALACSNSCRCPNQTYPGKIHNVRKLTDKYTKYVVYDMINNDPVKVALWAQKWQCNTCKKVFVDPSSPYKGKKMTTPDFEEYVASYYLSRFDLDVIDIGHELDISTEKVWQAVRNYRKRYVELKSQMQQPPYSKVWLIKHYSYEKPHLLILGELHSSELTIIGFCANDIEKAIATYNLNDPNNPVGEFLTDNKSIAKECERLGLPVRNIMAKDQGDTMPVQIYIICALLDDLEKRHYTLETMALRIEMIDEYRRNEMRRLRAGRFLFPKEKCQFKIKEIIEEEGWA